MAILDAFIPSAFEVMTKVAPPSLIERGIPSITVPASRFAPAEMRYVATVHISMDEANGSNESINRCHGHEDWHPGSHERIHGSHESIS
jgi:hypothetical protein